ncbi:MAG: tetratricopeptide repeat protein [Bacteroidota bacterium]|nr:tetratricopeptide repeat protein [Bacteroidota bacterium]
MKTKLLYLKYSCMAKKVIYSIIIIVFLLFQKNSFSQSKIIDSLKKELKLAKYDSLKITLLNKLIENEPDVNIWPDYNEQILKISERNAKKLQTNLDSFYYRNLATTLNNKASIDQVRGDIIGSLDLFERALSIYEKLNDKGNVGACLINIGGTYDNQGDMVKALEYYHKSIKVLEKTNNKEAMTVCFINLGNVYKKLKDFNTALKYYENGLKLSTESNDNRGIAASYNYIGIIYDNTGNKPLALEYYKKSLKIREEIGDKTGIAQSLNNIGNIYKNEKNLEEAINYFNRSLALYSQGQDKKGIVTALDNIAQTYLIDNQINKAYLYAAQGFGAAKKLASPKIIMNTAITMKRIFHKQNKFKDALEMLELEIKMRDSINNQETQKAAIKKQVQYTYEKRELELKAEQDKKDLTIKEKLEQKETERNYFIAGFAFVVVLILFVLRSYKQKKKVNTIILHQKNLVEEKQKEILASIHYAKRIQTALMPNENFLSKKIKW